MTKLNLRILIVLLGITFIAITIFVCYYILIPSAPTSLVVHGFQPKEIYPTLEGGREWFINIRDPVGDGIFDPGSSITKNSDDSWEIKGRDKTGKYEDQVRMNVNTLKGEKKWKNVEITGYALQLF